jgi:dTMP kinase
MSLFITIEGGEGAGKTTLIEALFSFFESKGLSVLKTRAPGGTECGLTLRNWLLDNRHLNLTVKTELLIFLADRAQHVQEVIRPALDKGMIVLCDRFNDSTVAYQGYARELGENTVEELCLFSSSNLQPHLTFYLDLDPLEANKRLNAAHKIKDKIVLNIIYNYFFIICSYIFCFLIIIIFII